MPFTRPTLSELRARAAAEFNARLPGADALLRMNNLRVTADVLAGLSHLHFGYLDWIARQVIPDTAETAYLDRWANIFGVPRKPAARAVGAAVFTGVNGATVDIGAILQTGDGRQYQTTAAGAIAVGTLMLAIEALEPGHAGNQETGVTLTLVSAIAGVNAGAVAAAPGLTGGADEESDDELRVRLLLRIQAPRQGGDQEDYVQWALEVPGVTRAWAYPSELGLGSVTVRFMMDEVNAGDDGIPQGSGDPNYSGDLLAVFQHLDPLRPVTARLYVVAPVAVPLDVTITGLVPDTAAVRAAIEAEIRDMIRRDAEPGGTIYRSRIWEAVSLASGESHHVITAPANDVVMATGQIATFGAITYA